MARSQRSKRQKKGQQRRATAQEGQNRLIAILNEPHGADERMLRSSARHLVRLSRRHRLSIPPEAHFHYSGPYRFGQYAGPQ